MLGKSLTGYEGKPHVWLEVAGDGNQDLISQAPSPDPTSGRAVEAVCEADFAFGECLLQFHPSSKPHGG